MTQVSAVDDQFGTHTVEMLRMFKLAKASAVKTRTQAINNSKPCSWRPTPRCAKHCPD